MRGTGKILMAFIAVVLLATPITSIGRDLRIRPTDEVTGVIFSAVRFDSVLYKLSMEVPCAMSFEKVDDEHHRVNIVTIPDGVMPYCEVSLQWGDFPPVVLGLEIGDSNSWLIGIETGYAEK